MSTAELEYRYGETIIAMTAEGLCAPGEIPSLQDLMQTIKDTVSDEPLQFGDFEQFFAWWDVTTAYDQMDAECSAEQHKPALEIAYEALALEGFFGAM